ncbi:MAG: hypothetical protein ACOCVM_09075 [Desulfovibrionaceae bacterium]
MRHPVIHAAQVLILAAAILAAGAAHAENVKLTNYAGDNLTAGTPVSIYTTGNTSEAFTIAPGNATWIAGVLQSACANGTACKVAVSGVGWVRLLSGCRNASGAYSPLQNCSGVTNGTAFNQTAAVGDWLIMSYADGQANATAALPSGNASAVNATIGRALSSNNGTAGHNRVKALLRIGD